MQRVKIKRNEVMQSVYMEQKQRLAMEAEEM
jgi:hypothetical protein